MKTSSEIKCYLESRKFKTDSIRVHHGRWIDTVSIAASEGMKITRLIKLLPDLTDFIGTESIRFTRAKTNVKLEVAKEFSPISESELDHTVPGLCLGLTRDDKQLMIDIRYGGLLIVGDHGTGKTTLLNQCRARLQNEFEFIEANAANLMELAERSKRKERLEQETILVADDYDKLDLKSLQNLIRIGLRGHLIGVYVIAATACFHTMTGLIESTFRNIVTLKLASKKDVWGTILPYNASSLTTPGDGILGSNLTDHTRFHTTNYTIMKIHEKEDALFAEWMEHQKRTLPGMDVENLFCPDGLHYSGKPVKRDGEHYVIERDYNEEELWQKSNRVVFISKDHNLRGEGEGVDVRDESGLDNRTDRLEQHFFKRYLMLNFLLGRMNLENGEAPSIEEARTDCLEYFHSCGVVRINAKKLAGGSECPQALLAEYMKVDEEFTRRQIGLYGGRIFVCLDGNDSSPIMKMLRSMYPDLETFNAGEEYKFIKYSVNAGIVVVHEWHPGCWVTDETYFAAVRQLSLFIKSHPGFFKV